MKKFTPAAFAALALALASNLAGATEYCDAWEYARLKDSSAKDLTEHACATKRNINANITAQLAVLKDFSKPMKEAEHIKEVQATCISQMKAIRSVYLQRFGKPVNDCSAEDEAQSK